MAARPYVRMCFVLQLNSIQFRHSHVAPFILPISWGPRGQTPLPCDQTLIAYPMVHQPVWLYLVLHILSIRVQAQRHVEMNPGPFILLIG